MSDKDSHQVPADADGSMSSHLKGISDSFRTNLRSYKDLGIDVLQSLLVLFLEYPAVGIFCTVTAGFVAVPVISFLIYALFSLVSVVISAVLIQGGLWMAGAVALFFATPVSFLFGIVAGGFSTALWLTLNCFVKTVRGRGILDDLVKSA